MAQALELGADTLLLDEQTLPEDFVICGRGEQDSSRAVFTFDVSYLHPCVLLNSHHARL